jgi:hypothetical protein
VNEFQLFLKLSQKIPARSAVELSARSASKELFQKTEVVRNLRRDWPSNSLKGEAGKLCLKGCKERRRFMRRVTSYVEERLVIS